MKYETGALGIIVCDARNFCDNLEDSHLHEIVVSVCFSVCPCSRNSVSVYL